MTEQAMGQVKIWTLTTENPDGYVGTTVVATEDELPGAFSAALDGWVDDDVFPTLNTPGEWEKAAREAGFLTVEVTSRIVRFSVGNLMDAVQEAQDAMYGYSNDSEIELLRDALDEALGYLGLDLPDGTDPDEEEDA
jgi:hypothetical protein